MLFSDLSPQRVLRTAIKGANMIIDKDLLSIQNARILAENAFEAQKKLAAFPQEKLDRIVDAVVGEVAKRTRELAVLSHEETGYGRWEDKWRKNRFVCEALGEQLRGMRCVGVLREDDQRRIMDIGVPLGVIVALCSPTSPVSTTVYTTLIALKSGNSVIFSPHPKAARCMGAALDIMMAAAHSCGLPEGCLSYLGPVTASGTQELMHHAATSLVMVSGVPGMFAEAKASGKPVIWGGTGSGPAFVERSADIPRAVADIVASKTFDNGIAPCAEQSIVVDAPVVGDVRQALQTYGAYFMTDGESCDLAALFFHPDGRRNNTVIGLPATVLAKKAGFSVPDKTTLLIAGRKYVCPSDPYSREFLGPVLACYVESDWLHACEKCIELLLHERNAHSLTVHSRDEEVIRQFALKKPVGRLLVNTPAAFGGMGMSTNLFPAMTLGGGAAGFGITADNVSPLNLVYTRKVGYGARLPDRAHEATLATTGAEAHDDGGDKGRRALRRILLEAIRAGIGSATIS